MAVMAIGMRDDMTRQKILKVSLVVLAYPTYVAVCWLIWELAHNLFGVDLTAEIIWSAVWNSIKTVLSLPFIAINIVLDAVTSAFMRLPFIGQIIIVVAVALWIVALIVDNAVRRIVER
jgi:type III secretory pathway component EscU